MEDKKWKKAARNGKKNNNNKKQQEKARNGNPLVRRHRLGP